MFIWNSLAIYDPMDVGNFISGSSAFSKFSLYIWTLSVHILLKASLENFEHYLTSVGKVATVWWCEHSLVLPFLGIGMRINLFQSCGCC